ncbi:DUF5011 domain-containing protein [Virgibacillus proomii]|uniref:DUF5011 domain-containing protein n=1 Tax=Virgibacillus proomii TaxID=84407 RepID=UPI001C4DDD12|nr:DUF5011 domain-containing protein [Virgibacillus proomii]
MIFYNDGLKIVHAKQETKTFDYECIAKTSIAGDILIDMKVTPTVSIPDMVNPHEKFSVSDIETAIEVDVTGSLAPLKGLINPFNDHLNQFHLQAANETVNVVGTEGVAIPETPFDNDAPFIPFSIGAIDASYTAGGVDVNIHVGEIKAEIHAKLGTTPVNLPVTCTPPEDTLLTTVKVEETEEEVDNDAPVITLNGDNPMTLNVGETYSEPGATAKDNVDGDLTEQMKISGEVITHKAGEYSITYTVTDKAGNKATATRTVYVEEAADPGDDDKPSDGDKPGDGDTPNDGEKPGDGAKPDDGEKPSDDQNPGDRDKPVNDEKPDDDNNIGVGNNNNDNPKQENTNKGGVLPNTATNIPFTLLIGTILLALGGSLHVFRKYIFN